MSIIEIYYFYSQVVNSHHIFKLYYELKQNKATTETNNIHIIKETIGQSYS
jgi:hypothetical protein